MKILKWLIFPIIIIIISFLFDFNHKSYSELNFKIIEFIYWTIVAGLIVFITFFIKIITDFKYYPYLIFLIVLLYYLYWIPYGIDITDHGYVLSQSWFEGDDNYISSAWQVRKGSFVIIGFWLHILNAPSVIWARLGYALVISGIALLSYKIITLYIKENRFLIFVSIVATSTIPIVKSSLTLNYNTIPIIIILLAFYILLRGVLYKKHFYFFLAGILISISVFSRIPYIPYLGLPFLIFMYIYFIDRVKRDFVKNIIVSYMGIVMGILLIVLYLVSVNSLTYYVGFLKNNVYDFLKIEHIESFKALCVTDTSSHGFSKLMTMYFMEFGDVFLLSLFFIFTFFLMPGILKLKGLLKIIVVICFAWLYFYYAYKVNYLNWYYSIIAPIIASLVIYFICKPKLIKAPLILIFLSLIFTILSFVGTNNGIQNIIHSGGIIFPLSLSLVLISDFKFKFKKFNFNFNISYLIFVFGIIYFSYVVKSGFVYRDSKREKLLFMSNTPALWGIFSTKERVNAIDSLVLAFDSLKIQDKEYQTINKNLLLPLITNRKPVSISWSVSFDKFLKYGYKIKFLIISKKNPRHNDWPKNKDLYDKRDKIEVDKFI